MDDAVLKAMAKWPDVPAVYGWLSLDRRGQWRLRGEVIAHQGAVDFIARNYQSDERGCWYFQNGPQRVFADLDYTPLVYFLDGAGTRFDDHCGRPADQVDRFWLDDDGALILNAEQGPGVLYDQDLATVLEWMTVESGDEDELEQVLENPQSASAAGLRIEWLGRWFPVEAIESRQLGAQLGFVPYPSQQDDDAAPAG